MQKSAFFYTNMIGWDAKDIYDTFNNYVSSASYMVPGLHFKNV